MSTAQNRFKRAKAPSGGSPAQPGVGAPVMSTAQNRFKQAKAPSGGSPAQPGVGAL